MMETEDKQISLTDPDARSMATSGRGSGMVGYNVQSAVDTRHHLIVAHEVINVGSDRHQLSDMTERARVAIGSEAIEVVADRGYYKGEEIVACEPAGCQACALKSKCTTGKERRISRWEHEAVLEVVQARLDRSPEKMRLRRQTVEHPFGTIKSWMGSTHFQMKRLKNVRTEMALHVLAYNMKRVMRLLGVGGLMEAIRA